MAETADSAAATGTTLNRQQPPPKGCTRPVGPESPKQNNIRTSKRHRVMDIRAPARFQLSRDINTQDRAGAATAATTNAITSIIAPHFAAARHAIQRRKIITTALAKAINNYIIGFKSPEDMGIANDL
ncbi:hypothetical protein K469DRAFT_688445 [Zopfia rhizophila CBS 207.26]|uniref:Uncharacterized protein n=1 Tax=Zopfia rhizophila CBS 207.26 TaxID=1314779 RepID=A0A6A6DZ58_9PEZI|nr:hypothetical protein K469DRAFT_688445 [Zopfia rhizophila CBS 207.26]